MICIKISCRSVPSRSPHDWSIPDVNTGKASYRYFSPYSDTSVVPSLRDVDRHRPLNSASDSSSSHIFPTAQPKTICPFASPLSAGSLCFWPHPGTFGSRSIQHWVEMWLFWCDAHNSGKGSSWVYFGREEAGCRGRRIRWKWRTNWTRLLADFPQLPFSVRKRKSHPWVNSILLIMMVMVVMPVSAKRMSIKMLVLMILRSRSFLLFSHYIITLPFFFVDESGIWISHFFEDIFGSFSLILIWMELQCKWSVSLLDLSLSGCSRDSENVVVIFFSEETANFLSNCLFFGCHVV